MDRFIYAFPKALKDVDQLLLIVVGWIPFLLALAIGCWLWWRLTRRLAGGRPRLTRFRFVSLRVSARSRRSSAILAVLIGFAFLVVAFFLAAWWRPLAESLVKAILVGAAGQVVTAAGVWQGWRHYRFPAVEGRPGRVRWLVFSWLFLLLAALAALPIVPWFWAWTLLWFAFLAMWPIGIAVGLLGRLVRCPWPVAVALSAAILSWLVIRQGPPVAIAGWLSRDQVFSSYHRRYGVSPVPSIFAFDEENNLAALRLLEWFNLPFSPAALKGYAGLYCVPALCEMFDEQSPETRSYSIRAINGDLRAFDTMSQAILTHPQYGALSSLYDPRDVASSLADGVIQGLGRIGTSEAQRLLTRIARDNPLALINVIEALGEMRDPETALFLLDFLRGAESNISGASASAAEVLATKLADPQLIEPLVGLMRREDADVRLTAAYVLSGLGDERARPVLEEAMSGELTTFYRRWYVVNAVANYPGPWARSFINNYLVRADRSDLIVLLFALGMDGVDRDLFDSETVNLLCGFLNHGDNDTVAGMVCAALGNAGRPEAIPAVMEFYRDNPRRRISAVMTLGELRAREALDLVSEMMVRAESPWARWSAAAALLRIDQGQVPRVVDQAIDFLRSEPEYVPDKLFEILAAHGDARLVPLLIERLGNYCLRQRGDADVLGRLGDARAVEPLLESLRVDPSWEIRGAAAAALGYFDDPRILDALQRALTELQSMPARADVLRGLGRLARREPAALAPVVAALEEHELVLMREAAAQGLAGVRDERAIDALIVALGRDRSVWVRRAAADSLGETGGDRARAALRAALPAERSPQVRKAMSAALDRGGPSE